MAKLPRFSEAFLRAVITILDQPAGATMADVIKVTGKQPDSVAKALRVVGKKMWAGNRTTAAQYLLHEDAETRLRDHVGNVANERAPEPPALNFSVDGMCPGCTCDPDASLFVVQHGRLVLPACPRDTFRPVHRVVAETGPLLRREIRVPAPELLRRAVIRALRRSDEPLAMTALCAATQRCEDELTAPIAQLLQAGDIVRLLRTRAGSQGRASVAVFALPRQLPEPLRAS